MTSNQYDDKDYYFPIKINNINNDNNNNGEKDHHHNDTKVLRERIAELEEQLNIVREAATVGAENDAIKIQQLNKKITDLQEENKLLRDELMQLRGQTQLNDTAQQRQSTSVSHPVSPDRVNAISRMERVSSLISQSQRDMEWLIQETDRRRQSIGALRQRNSMELINMKKRLSM